MTILRSITVAVALFAAAPLAAVTSTRVAAPPAGATPVDPARLAAAQALIETIMPASQRDAMINGMTGSLLQNMVASMGANAEFRTAMNNDPRVRQIFDSFVKRQQAATTATIRQSMPGMAAALARAYARRFDIAQLREITTFFATPTGRAYSHVSTTVMRDPDVAAWQQSVMKTALTRIQADAKALAAEITALPPRPKGS